MAFLDIFIMKRTIRVEIIIVVTTDTLFHVDSDVSKNFTFIIFISDRNFVFKDAQRILQL